jgi:hypothetical protein
MQQLARRGLVGVTTAFHTTRGSLATGRTAVLADRDTDSPLFAEKKRNMPQSQRSEKKEKTKEGDQP